jgi:threonine/homoserine/homoserine lactone efflux protein
MEAFFRGIVLGLTIAAPVGPIGLLCIRRTLSHGWRAGFVSGLGAATADVCYGMLAVFGLTALTTFQRPAAVIGGFLLLYMGWQTTRMVPTQTANAKPGNMYLSTLTLTITNPATILVFIGLFSGMSGVRQLSQSAAMALVAGVGVGSALWWLTVSQITTWLGRDITPQGMLWINRLSGIIIFGFGIAALWSSII